MRPIGALTVPASSGVDESLARMSRSGVGTAGSLLGALRLNFVATF